LTAAPPRARKRQGGSASRDADVMSPTPAFNTPLIYSLRHIAP
jgi:hypothetical protein